MAAIRRSLIAIAIFVGLGPLVGMLLFGVSQGGLGGAGSVMFLFLLGAAWLTGPAAAIYGLFGGVPGLAGAIAVLAVPARSPRWQRFAAACAASATAELAVVLGIGVPDEAFALGICAALTALLCTAMVERAWREDAANRLASVLASD